MGRESLTSFQRVYAPWYDAVNNVICENLASDVSYQILLLNHSVLLVANIWFSSLLTINLLMLKHGC